MTKRLLQLKHSPLSRQILPAVGALCALIAPQLEADSCSPQVYTTTAQFNAGTRFNTIGANDAEDGRLQLVDQGSITTFPTLWPANAGEDTVTKFDTNLNKEVGRYRTWFNVGFHGEFSGPAPSRTAVDAAGNVYVVNRHFDNRPIFVLKILTSDTGAVDRNGNGVIDTAQDTNNNGIIDAGEILPVLDDGGFGGGGIAGNGIPELAEFRDERVAWVRQVGVNNALGRACAIDPAGDIWVGAYNTAQYFKLSGATGAILAGPIGTPGMNPYGAVVDAAGRLYSASLGNAMGEINTNTNAFINRNAGIANYGIALDNSRSRVYLGQGNPYRIFHTDTNTFSSPAAGTNSRGISTAANGDILVHGSNAGFPNHVPGASGGFVGVARFRPDHSVAWSSGAQPGATGGASRGIAPDANGDIYTINLDTNNVSKFRGINGAHLGVFPIGSRPYSYSDLSGSSFQQTNPSGTWSSEFSDLLRGNKECKVTWNAGGGGTVKVELAGSNTAGAPGPFVVATNGVVVPGVAGKYITVRVTLQSVNQQGPHVTDLRIKSCPQIGDFNADCCVDNQDYILMRNAYTARSTDPVWDVNADGVFNIADLRYETLLFCSSGGGACCCGGE